MPTLKLGSTTALTETSGALTINVANPTVTLGSNATFNAPNLGTPSAVTLTNATFPAGHVIRHSYVTLGADVYRQGTTGWYTMWTPTYTPTGGSGTRIITNFHCAFSTYDLNDESAQHKFKYDITGSDITNVTDQYNIYWNSVMTDSSSGVNRLYLGSTTNLRERTITGNSVITYTLKIELFDASLHYVDFNGNGTEAETCLEIWEITT